MCDRRYTSSLGNTWLQSAILCTIKGSYDDDILYPVSNIVGWNCNGFVPKGTSPGDELS